MLTSSWQDVAVPLKGTTAWLVFVNAVAEVGPISVVLGSVAIVLLLVHKNKQWLLWALAVWAVTQLLFFHAVALKVPRYLSYMSPAVCILAAWAIWQVIGRAQWQTRMAVPALFVAVTWGMTLSADSMGPMRGYDRAASVITRLAGNQPVVFSGLYDGVFILYRRLGDPELESITFRSTKLFGGGVILPDRAYEAYVGSPRELRQRFRDTGAGFVVLDDRLENASPEHRWFREWVKGDDFERVEEIPIEYPWGTSIPLVVYRYRNLGPPAPTVNIPMRTLNTGEIEFEPGRSLINWNQSRTSAGGPTPLSASQSAFPD